MEILGVIGIYIYTYLKEIPVFNIIWIPKYPSVFYFNKLIIMKWFTNPMCHMNTKWLGSKVKVEISVFIGLYNLEYL